MLSHTVVFWLKEEHRNAADLKRFREALLDLRRIEQVNLLHVGKPAAVPDRPVLDLSFDVQVTVLFDDVADHNDYQTHPLHVKFLEECVKTMVDRVVIYDAD